jgi:hypothetical protein
MDILFCFSLGLSLTYATRDGRAFGDIHAVLILGYGDEKLQFDHLEK